MSQCTKQLGLGKKIRQNWGNLTKLSVRSTSTHSRRCLCSSAWRYSHSFHLTTLYRLDSNRRTGPCVYDEISQHTKQLRQRKKIRQEKNYNLIVRSTIVLQQWYRFWSRTLPVPPLLTHVCTHHTTPTPPHVHTPHVHVHSGHSVSCASDQDSCLLCDN